jgi:hypothetical protein
MEEYRRRFPELDEEVIVDLCPDAPLLARYVEIDGTGFWRIADPFTGEFCHIHAGEDDMWENSARIPRDEEE